MITSMRFTRKFDEISAETLEKDDEIQKLRKNLDQQLTNFQDLVTNWQTSFKDSCC